MLIRKPRLYCSEFVLGDDDAHPEQQIRMTGDAGLQDDRSIKLKIDINALNVSPWMPEKLRSHVSGHASGHFEYSSTGSGLETASGNGNIAIVDGVLHELAPVHQYIAITGSPDPGDLALKVCQADINWKEDALTAQNIKMECDGVFRLEGTISIAKDQTLSGSLELGLTDPYLKWLPTAQTEYLYARRRAVSLHPHPAFRHRQKTGSGSLGAPLQGSRQIALDRPKALLQPGG